MSDEFYQNHHNFTVGKSLDGMKISYLGLLRSDFRVAGKPDKLPSVPFTAELWVVTVMGKKRTGIKPYNFSQFTAAQAGGGSQYKRYNGLFQGAMHGKADLAELPETITVDEDEAKVAVEYWCKLADETEIPCLITMAKKA